MDLKKREKKYKISTLSGEFDQRWRCKPTSGVAPAVARPALSAPVAVAVGRGPVQTARDLL